MSPSPVTIAFVGCGNIAQKHLGALPYCQDPPLRVTAVCDPNPEAAAHFADQIAQQLTALGTDNNVTLSAAKTAALRPLVFASLAEALAFEKQRGEALFEAVDIMVPNFLHEEVTLAAIAAGKHVLKEKPVGITLAAAARIMKAKPEGRVLMVAENAQWFPDVLHARKLIEEGVIGEVIGISAKCWESAAGEWGAGYRPGAWRSNAKRAGGGFVFDSLSHWIRPLRMLFGEITEVVAMTGRTLSTMEGQSSAQALLQFASGQTAMIEAILCPSVISKQPWFRFQGTKGEIVIDGDFSGGGTLHVEGQADPQIGEAFPASNGWDDSYAAELQTFASAVASRDGRAALEGNLDEALNDLKVITAIHKSGAERRWIHLDDLE